MIESRIDDADVAVVESEKDETVDNLNAYKNGQVLVAVRKIFDEIMVAEDIIVFGLSSDC